MPIGRETHLSKKNRLKRKQMVEQPTGPICGRFNYCHNEDEQHKGIVKTPILNRMQVGDDWHRRTPGQLKSDCEAAIPKARVMGTEITDIYAVFQKRFQDVGRHSISRGNLFPVMFALDILVKSAEKPERHDLTCRPNGGGGAYGICYDND